MTVLPAPAGAPAGGPTATDAPQRASRLPSAWAGIVGFALAVPAAIQVLPWFTDMTSRFATNRGDPVFIMWQLTLQTHDLTSKPLSLLQGNIFWPLHDTVAYSDNMIGFLPVYAPAYWLTGGNPIVAYNVTALVFSWLTGLAVYLLAAHLLRDRWSALGAAVLFMALPYHAAAVAHLQMTGFLFVPLALRWLMLAVETGRLRYGVLVGTCLAGAWYTSLYAFEMLILATGVFAGVWAATHWRAVTRRTLASAIAAAVTGATLIAPTAPAYLGVARSGVITRSNANLVTASPVGFVTLPPSPLYTSLGVAHPGLIDARAFFPGAVLLILAMGATVRLLRRGLATRRVASTAARSGARDDQSRRSSGYALPLAAVAVSGLLVMVGPSHGVLSGADRALRAVVPGMSSLRDLTRFWLLPATALALAAGFGLRNVLRRMPCRLTAATTLLVLLAACCETLFRPGFRDLDYAGRSATVNRLLATLAPGPVVELPLTEPSGPLYAYIVAPRQLRSIIDALPRIEGYSGAYPSSALTAIAWARSLPAPEAVAALRHDGVRYIVLHGGAYACAASFSTAELAALEDRLRSNPGVAAIATAGEDVIVTLVPDPAAAPGSMPVPPPAPGRDAAVCDLF